MVLAPDMKGEWAMALDGKLKPSFDILRKGSAYQGHLPQICLDIPFPGLKILRIGFGRQASPGNYKFDSSAGLM